MSWSFWLDFLNLDKKQLPFFIALCVAVVLALSFGGILVCGKMRERKKRRAETARKVQYTLPDRENRYVRARLATALRVEEIEKAVDKRCVGIRLGYAQKMLACIKEKPLTPVERLDVEEMCGFIAACGGMEKWTSSDVKGINEVLARLLKLSAKYEIAV